MSRKKKILYQSDFALAKTGFGRCSKALLTYLYKTGKYEIFHYCCGVVHSANPNLAKTPWKSVGTLPDTQQEMDKYSQDPKMEQLVGYGALYLDKVVEDFKPDIYLAAQDIWGIEFAQNKNWFKKMNTIFWTTLDSLPILPQATKAAKKMENFWIWSNFATKAMNEEGMKNVKTMHGPIEDSYFRILPPETKKEMRKHFGIPEDMFIIGFVFRNQLRKSVPNLLEGYSIWKKNNPDKNSGLLLHTFFGEGWNIPKLANEYGIDQKEILTTYICKSCNNYIVTSFSGHQVDCPFCGDKKGMSTTNVNLGVSEWQLCDVYNLMDAYCHPFTSGGQEYPIQEAKLCGLTTLVTNYSCGQEMCEEGAHSLPLEWSEYREHGTEFIKASTSPESIAAQIQKVYDMSPEERLEKGQKAREWTLENYSIEKIGAKMEEVFDNMPEIDWDKISLKPETKNPDYVMPDIKDDESWLIHLYHNVMKMDYLDEHDQIIKEYALKLKTQEISRKDLENNLRQEARRSVNEEKMKDFSKWVDEDDEGKRILYSMPGDDNDVFMSTSLFESIKKTYPDYNLYVATEPQYHEIISGNPYVHKVLPYFPEMDNAFWTEGRGMHKGFFQISLSPHLSTQKNIDYLHNGVDKIPFNLKEA